MPPPGSDAQGFIADSVKGNLGELVWGQPYHFVEVKGRGEMALAGNLKAMLTYVEMFGGHLEVWFRSSKHAKGKTELTKPLQVQLERLRSQGRVTVQYAPGEASP